MSTVAEIVRRFDRRSRFHWERPRLGRSVCWWVDGSELVYVPAGRFLMGSADDDPEAFDNENPQHEVELSAFWLQSHEVTNAQFARFVAVTGHDAGEWWRQYAEGREQHPVVGVSWEDAQAYCEWAGLRLPTEAEWEYAARGPEGRRYPWGDEWDGSKLCWGENRGEGQVKTLPVGSLLEDASWCGALGLAGNVMEWCADWYDHPYAAGLAVDPQGPQTGERRVVRGGSWHPDFPRMLRAAYRYSLIPLASVCRRMLTLGFRCARGL